MRREHLSKKLERRVINTIIQSQTNFQDMTRLERYVFAQDAFDLIRDYCCSLYYINPNRIETGFANMGSAGVCMYPRPEEGQEKYCVYVRDFLPLLDTPERMLKTMMHEMKHVAQLEHKRIEGIRKAKKAALKGKGGSIKQSDTSHRVTPSKTALANRYTYSTSYMGWASSSRETDADMFAYSKLSHLTIKAMLKNKEARPQLARSLAATVTEGASRMLTHFIAPPIAFAERLYNLATINRGNKEETIRRKNERVVVTLEDVVAAANERPDLFCVKTPKSGVCIRVKKIEVPVEDMESSELVTAMARRREAPTKLAAADNSRRESRNATNFYEQEDSATRATHIIGSIRKGTPTIQLAEEQGSHNASGVSLNINKQAPITLTANEQAPTLEQIEGAINPSESSGQEVSLEQPLTEKELLMQKYMLSSEQQDDVEEPSLDVSSNTSTQQEISKEECFVSTAQTIPVLINQPKLEQSSAQEFTPEQ